VIVSNILVYCLHYVWSSYRNTCYKGESRTTISLTYKYQDNGANDENYNRTKFEITTEIKFFNSLFSLILLEIEDKNSDSYSKSFSYKNL
jgi:hypothetical protein|tara:strand:- start:10 stop:279 length:270 start_codon:yes stop_codon:yes gene_type:complete